MCLRRDAVHIPVSKSVLSPSPMIVSIGIFQCLPTAGLYVVVGDKVGGAFAGAGVVGAVSDGGSAAIEA